MSKLLSPLIIPRETVEEVFHVMPRGKISKRHGKWCLDYERRPKWGGYFDTFQACLFRMDLHAEFFYHFERDKTLKKPVTIRKPDSFNMWGAGG